MRILGHIFKAVLLSQNRTYEIFFASWNEKGRSKVMSFFLSKNVENSCVGTAKCTDIDVITLEELLQPPYSHYMDLVSYDFTNNFGKMPFLVVLFTHLLATRGDDQTYYIWYRWLLSNHCCQGTRKMET